MQCETLFCEKKTLPQSQTCFCIRCVDNVERYSDFYSSPRKCTSFTHPRVIVKLYDLFSSTGHKQGFLYNVLVAALHEITMNKDWSFDASKGTQKHQSTLSKINVPKKIFHGDAMEELQYVWFPKIYFSEQILKEPWLFKDVFLLVFCLYYDRTV